jgi:hypothetical protein
VKPEIADQVSLGYSRNFNNNNYELNAEIYYKSMQNQIDFKNGAQIAFDTGADVESELLSEKEEPTVWKSLPKRKAESLQDGFPILYLKRKEKSTESMIIMVQCQNGQNT